MQPSAFRHHVTKIVDYGLRALLVCVLIIPLLSWLSMSGGLGSEPPDHGEPVFAVLLFVVVAPGYYGVRLLDMLGISSGFVGWMVAFIVVPLFWGAATYTLVQLSRRALYMARPRLTRRWSERRTLAGPHFR